MGWRLALAFWCSAACFLLRSRKMARGVRLLCDGPLLFLLSASLSCDEDLRTFPFLISNFSLAFRLPLVPRTSKDTDAVDDGGVFEYRRKI